MEIFGLCQYFFFNLTDILSQLMGLVTDFMPTSGRGIDNIDREFNTNVRLCSVNHF